MLFYIPVAILVTITVIAIMIVKELQALPIIERKRRARLDRAHKQLYALRAHGLEAFLLLWMIIVLSLCVAVAVILQKFSPAISSVIVISLLGLLFGWLLHAPVRLPLRVLARISVMLERLTSWCAPVLRRIASIVRSWSKPARQAHAVFEKDDLLAFVKTLESDKEVRIPSDELKLVENSLTYGDKLIRYYMTPRRMIKMVSADEEISPIMLDELYKGGFSRLPVYEGSEDTIVGTLHIKDLLEHKEAKTVRQIMQRKAFYVHEDLTLSHALKAFLKTKHHMFIVVNQFQEVVGLITIEDVLEQIIGQNIVDEFDQYDDLRAVAALHAKQDRQQNSENMV